MSDIAWYQKKTTSIISLITAVVAICGFIVSIMWYGRILDEMSEDVKELKQAQMEQIEINSRVLTIIEMTQ